ncbi:unnamed protein product [Fusarium graminearum]|nr:unnamed protein product [Fusarium graminearum]CAF3511922.1 unnamed protein product [Fusarium graminearum]CAF3613858.1 unnamed protein product [Fusarium graminearum]CAG1994176.1 unnamed protein product [Fusarium graminearum]
MYLSIIILPLLGSIVSGFFGRKVGVTGSRILGCLSIMITTILAIISFFELFKFIHFYDDNTSNRIAANQSSLSAFLTNRVGDAFLMIGTLDYSTVFSLAPYINENITTIIGICLLIGAMAKSSQVGLHI